MSKLLISKTILTLILFVFTPITASQAQYIKGPYPANSALAAPEWKISEWVKGPELKLSEQRGKVVVIDFFQLWCPGCNRFSIPLMAKWEKQFAPEIEMGKLVLVSIHTVFEGHSFQTNKRLREFIKEKNFKHPVGVDYNAPGRRIPETMIRYKTRGTPEVAIIDKNGRLRFQGFGSFNAQWATAYIRELLKETGPTG